LGLGALIVSHGGLEVLRPNLLKEVVSTSPARLIVSHLEELIERDPIITMGREKQA
jgi:hypothetical protein